MLDDNRLAHNDETLGGRISLARDAKAFSMEHAAERLGVLPSSWRAWECDRDVPRGNRLTTMAGILGVSPSWLLTGLGRGPMRPGIDGHPQDLPQMMRRISKEIEALNERMRQIALHLGDDASARNKGP